MHVVYERCAAIDVGKDEIAVAVRMPGDGPEGRVTVKRTFRTFYGVMGEAARWRARERYGREAMVRRFEDFYAGLVNKAA